MLVFFLILCLPFFVNGECSQHNDEKYHGNEADVCRAEPEANMVEATNCFDHFVYYATGFCYGVIDYINIHEFEVADDVCRRLDGHLVSIHSQNEETIIINTFVKSEHDIFWIGLRCVRGGRNCKWTDGSTVDYLLPHGIRNCGVIFDNGIGTLDCPEEHFWICKRPLYKTAISPPASMTTSQNTPTCNDNYIYFEPTGFCYGIIDYINYHKFSVAEDWCTHLDGHLASIHSRQEEDFLKNYVSAVGHPLYIGLHNMGDRNYQWTDGSPTDYMPPSFDHDCGVLGGSGMYFDHCEITHFWICKKKPIF